MLLCLYWVTSVTSGLQSSGSEGIGLLGCLLGCLVFFAATAVKLAVELSPAGPVFTILDVQIMPG